jgi:predicted DNA-binding ribbon-helix-helix protein
MGVMPRGNVLKKSASKKKSPPKTEGTMERRPIKLEKGLHEKLKFVAAAQKMRLMDLLDSMAEREINAWEKMHGVSVDDLLAKGASWSGEGRD